MTLHPHTHKINVSNEEDLEQIPTVIVTFVQGKTISIIPYIISFIPLALIPYFILSLFPHPLSLISYSLSLTPYQLYIISYPISLFNYPIKLGGVLIVHKFLELKKNFRPPSSPLNANLLFKMPF